ncbi:HlyD family secretion protein [Sphingobacterium sp. UDSM-2020]|uniref:HlyD family secretion protein n=1 Tax=Sphingobacterium sp. UDSM-2020 TaxID=2795738 RepID=UPI00193527C4|nr:hypothetical protein [Sphingobacterium sp. UDSM-2020]QQD16195.1 hypothetical protein JAZ75_12020 [Sphingobacterium sp. UDSM-2020]
MDELDDTEKSEYVKDVLSRMPNGAGRYGIWIVCAILSVFFIIMKLINYPEVINGNVEIISKSVPVDIKPAISGRYISLVEGVNLMKVDSGQILGYIYSPLDFRIAISLKEDLSNLGDSKIIKKYSKIYFADLQSDYNEFKKSFLDQDSYYTLRPDSKQKISYKNQITSLSKTISSKQKEIELIDDQLKLQQKDLDRYKFLFEKSVISSQEFDNVQRNFISSKRDKENLISSLNESKSALLALEGNMNQSQISDNIQTDSRDDALFSAKNKLMANLIKWIDEHVIYAPFSGQLGGFKSLAKWSSITPDDVIYILSPENNEVLYGLATVSNINAGKIKLGQKVNVRLNDFPVSEFGWLKGTLQNISLSKRDNNYVAIIKLDSFITTYNIKIELKPEISGTAEIITQDYSLLDRLFFGIRKVFSERIVRSQSVQ